jgi:hypothetical protein
MKKIHLVLALVLAAGASFAFQNKSVDETFTIVDDAHPLKGTQGNFSTIKDLCPDPETFVCATGNQGGTIYWNR